MPDLTCTNDLVIAIVALLVAVTTFVNFILAYFRHQHIMSDNQRLLHVIEGKTAKRSDVKDER